MMHGTLGTVGVADLSSDVDSDELTLLQEAELGSNPLVDEATVAAMRTNYSYTKVGRLHQVTGVQTLTFDFDKEGNLKSAQ